MLQLFNQRKNQSGFTLIELLVVTAIIGILATFILASLNEARIKARDVRRVADLRQVALALEMYYDDHSAGYPGTSGSNLYQTTLTSELKTNGYISSVPSDPGVNTYEYWVASDNQGYVLKATLENSDSFWLSDDVDGADVLGCNCVDPGYCIRMGF
jgi:prepilin-type N-terminal cleavage/methylation domain-containing protein